uniref:uncharacterized protein LOC122595010 n=1 Tax=Erigeron canadensis TaxID=72917 RepID=UPI001CB98C05|nr:uncharacterized protein LOC122595010 [Erigeron canadensis]
MDREALSCALYLIKNSPNLTTLSIRSSSRSSSTDSLDLEVFPDFKLDHLQNLWIVAMRILPIEFKFLKLLMSRASMLKQAFVEVDSSVYSLEDLKVFKESIWEPYPIAS